MSQAKPATQSGDWITIDQNLINLFAEVSRDAQGIHVDNAFAKQSGFPSTIAHGMLTFSLVIPEVVKLLGDYNEGRTTINYGCNKVRYLAPVLSGSAIRTHMKVLHVEEKSNGQQLITLETSVEIESQEKPAMVAELLMLIV